MTLFPGTRFGPYEVIAQIGVGGMSEVYRATDTNLKRPVALEYRERRPMQWRTKRIIPTKRAEIADFV